MGRSMQHRCASSSAISMEVRDGGVAFVTLDDPSEKMNVLSSKLRDEFESTLSSIESDDNIKSVVLISGKDNCFVAGADIKELAGLETREDVAALIDLGQGMMNRIENSKKPFVAAIHGPALGGGLELAMACHYRIATEHKKTVLALPEVMLGLLPGAGGTQRLPRLVGLQKALPLMLTGKNVRPKQAKRMGLVDQLADPFALEHAATQAAQQLASGELKTKKKKKSFADKLIEDTPLNNIAFQMAQKQVTKQTGGKYPAPYKIIDVIKNSYGQSHTKGSKHEADGFCDLALSPESAALKGIYFGQNALKKSRFGEAEKKVETIAVVGAGLMGAGIAQVSAAKGYRVLLKDRDAPAVGRGEDYVSKNLAKRVKKRQMTTFEMDKVMSDIVGLHDSLDVWPKHMSQADLVVEAVFEDLDLKHRIVKEMEEHVPEHCIIATNTSALPIADIAKASKRPENVIGMHYFSPVPQMPLLEIIMHEGTSEQVAASAVEVGTRQGKTCVVVKDVPGFYVNRCLGPFLSESMALVQDGVDLLQLDKAMKSFGMPVGPITLADEVGVDVASHVATFLGKAPGMEVRMQGGDPAVMSDMVNKGFLGKKTGKGFFVHPPEGQKQKGPRQLNPEAVELIKPYLRADKLTLTDEEIQQRMMSRFVNEAVMCLQDDIIASAADGDIGAVFGIGFPPFIGGPFRYVDAMGSAKFCDMMMGFADKYGEQFTPCQTIQDMAKTNAKFHN